VAATYPESPAVEFCARTHVGRVRKRNEDSLEFRADRGWAVLADGMGGYRGGDVASQVAVAAVLASLEHQARRQGTGSPDDVGRALLVSACDANAAILQVAGERPELAGMGATLVVAAFLEDCVVCAHVGDSRLYRLRQGVATRLTRDHTMLQEQVDAGIMSADEAARMGFKGMLTRGLGIAPTVKPGLGVHPLRAGDVFLLCSDGLTDLVGDDDIAAEVDPLGALEASADRLVDLANRNGGRDNVSVILARLAP
jgi:serine/threonine protein phosphatase PrpC